MSETKDQSIARLEAELVLANNSEILRTQTDELLLKLNSSNVTVFELKAELESLSAKYLAAERDYILPLFKYATELGFDLAQAVRDNAGKNCTVLFYEKVKAELAASRKMGPCGKHPKACYRFTISRVDGLPESAVCDACAELAASREKIVNLEFSVASLSDSMAVHETQLAATRAECYERAAKRCCMWCAMGLDRIGVYHVAWKDIGQHLCQALDFDSLITPSDAAAREDWIRRIRLEEAEWWNKQFCSDEFDADLDLVIKRLKSLRASVPAARVGDDPSADVGLIGNPAVCPMCGGIGTYPNSYSIHNREECPSCHGTGKRESK